MKAINHVLKTKAYHGEMLMFF